MNISFTWEKLVWAAIAIFATVGAILGIAATAKDVMMGSMKPLDVIGEDGFSNLPSEIKTHVIMAVAGGFIAIFSGMIAIALGGLATKKNLEITHVITYVGGALALISFVFGVTAMVMNADLNDAAWFTKIALSSVRNII